MKLLFASLICSFVHLALAQDVGHFSITSSEVGTVVELTGKWQFRPGSTASTKFLPVPVPQMLSRIQWWLDDSEDFKQWEQARLDALGFDTQKTDDGTYRITFDVPKDWPKDRHLWVEFDGVAMQCKTSCNGKQVGEHKGMFSRFAYDLTEHLKPGETNELTVWVSMEKFPQAEGDLGQAVTVNLSAAKVISMSKGMFGPFTAGQPSRAYDLYGIWQPVKLVVRGPARINDAFFQPSDALDGARVDVEVQSHGYMGKLKVRAKWLDPDPKVLERFELSQTADLAGLAHVSLEGTGIKPKLWTPANPNLYRLEVTAEKPDGTILDKWTHNVGFRTFRIEGNQLLLNGKPYWLRGANQLPYGKNPWDPSLARKLIQFMHDGNINSTRTHATPWNEPWLNAADEIGLAVSIEGIRPWAFAGRTEAGKTVMPPPEIFQHWLMENEDVIKRCRNHPSVVMFTVGNEMLLRDSKNLEKWKLLSEVTKQTRKLAPGYPIAVSSDYVREPEFYERPSSPPASTTATSTTCTAITAGTRPRPSSSIPARTRSG
jgi:beta-galactosidase/beta-glucuronidase